MGGITKIIGERIYGVQRVPHIHSRGGQEDTVESLQLLSPLKKSVKVGRDCKWRPGGQ